MMLLEFVFNVMIIKPNRTFFNKHSFYFVLIVLKSIMNSMTLNDNE